MKTPLLIYGAGGLGRELLSLVHALENFEVIGFLDDHIPRDTTVKGITVLGGAEVLRSFEKPINVVLAFGDPAMKAAKAVSIPHNLVRYPQIIHPRAILQDSSSIKIGPGSVLCAGVVLTTDIVIGDHTLINLNCTVGHDSRIGSFCSLMPGVHVSGEVLISNEVLIGAGATILNQLEIGAKAKIGMGSVVIRNVDAGLMVAGVPAQPMVSRPHPKFQS
ncbi:MAG: acetyltransferase [Chryseolinea sp.]